MDSYTFSSVNVSNITVGGNRERGMPPFFLIGNASISGMLNLIGDINIGTSTGNGIILKRKSDSDFGSVKRQVDPSPRNSTFSFAPARKNFPIVAPQPNISSSG